jgi:hypothetical protein
VIADAAELGASASHFRECLPRPLDARRLVAALERLAAPVA